jgi:hypothetical protein
MTAIAGIASGFPVGLLIKSGVERKLRQIQPWLPFGSSSPARILVGVGVKIVVVAALLFVPSTLLLRALGLVPLYGDGYRAFVFALLGSILLGKLCRYAYWRRKA